MCCSWCSVALARKDTGVLDSNLTKSQPENELQRDEDSTALFRGNSSPSCDQDTGHQTSNSRATAAAALNTSSEKYDVAQHSDSPHVAGAPYQRKGGTAVTKQKWNSYSNTVATQLSSDRAMLLESPAELLAAALQYSRPARLMLAAILAVMTITCTTAEGHSEISATAGIFQQLWHGMLAIWARQLQYMPPLITLALLDIGLIWGIYRLLLVQPSLAGSKVIPHNVCAVCKRGLICVLL